MQTLGLSMYVAHVRCGQASQFGVSGSKATALTARLPKPNHCCRVQAQRKSRFRIFTFNEIKKRRNPWSAESALPFINGTRR